jgi:hypothetical protein
MSYDFASVLIFELNGPSNEGEMSISRTKIKGHPGLQGDILGAVDGFLLKHCQSFPIV